MSCKEAMKVDAIIHRDVDPRSDHLQSGTTGADGCMEIGLWKCSGEMFCCWFRQH